VFNKPGNFPEIEQAVADAQKAINDVNDTINKYQDKEWLPFTEGIEPVLNAIAEANEAIENVKTVADQMKKENDDAYAAGLEKYDDLMDQLPVAIEDTLQKTQTYKDAMADAYKAIEDYKSLLEHDDSLGLCDKDSTALKEKYEDAVAELEAAQDIINDLVELNGMIDLNNQDLAEAEDELQRIIDDYKYMEDGEKTKDLIDAIKQKIEDLHDAIDELTEEINSADDWKDLNDPDKVQEWKDRLNDINGQINGVENPETGELEGGLDQDIENAEETYIKYHKQGDANMDGDIDPTDYAEIIEYVLENKDIKKVTQERYDQLNVIPQDGNKVTIADATAVINLYYYGDVNGLPSARTISDAVESLTAETSLVNGTHRTALSLSNANSYVAAQMDVVVPEGMKVTGVKLSGRNGSHDLLTNTLADGTLRIVVSSMENVAFSGNEGAVLYIETEGAGTLEYRDVMFVTAGAEPVEFTVGAAETTGISSVKSAEGVKEAVYNLGGRLVNTLKKGVNIIRRANGTTDKVVMK
jgi:DNA repair exonuclease SbcCD ATPase subunit